MHDLELGEPGGVSAPRILRTTAEHPFWVHGKGWTPTGELASGDRIPGLAPRESVSVRSVSQTRRYAKLYNLRVEDYHTYYVGQPSWGFAVWSHNLSCSQHAKILGKNLADAAAKKLTGVLQRAGDKFGKLRGHLVPTGNWFHRGKEIGGKVKQMQKWLNEAGIGLDHFRNGFMTRSTRHLGTHTNDFIHFAHSKLAEASGKGRAEMLTKLDEILIEIRNGKF